MITSEQHVSRWYESVSLLRAPFEQPSLDRVRLGSEDPVRSDFTFAVAMFNALVREIARSRRSESALLAVPLECSDTLDVREPDADEWASRAWSCSAGHEVPALYVIESEIILGFDAAEEYRCLLRSPPATGASQSYYRCWRTATDRDAHCEFARAVYFVRTSDVGADVVVRRDGPDS